MNIAAFAVACEIAWTLITVAGGSVLALTLARHLPELPAGLLAVANPARGAMLAIGGGLERVDLGLRQWSVAALSLLLLSLLFGLAMRAHG